MFFNVFKCNSCGEESIPDFDSTFNEYLEKEFTEDSLLILPSQEAPKIPDYLMLKCNNPECNKIEKITHDELLKKIRKGWADLAFRYRQEQNMDKFQFEQFSTKYLVDRVTRNIITKKDLENNLILRDLYKFLEKEDE